MSSVLDSITLDELKGTWTGASATPNFTNIYVAPDFVPELNALLGQAGANVKPTPADGIEAAVWGDKMGLAIVPFDALERQAARDQGGRRSRRWTTGSSAEQWPLTAAAYLAAGKTRRGEEAQAATADIAAITQSRRRPS